MLVMFPHPAWLGAAAALLAFILPATPARAEVTVKTVSCMNLPNCLSLSNAHVEVIVTTDIGPRVIGYRRLTGRNVLAEMPGKVGSSEWQAWGGHRLWLAPEAMPFSYAPDNEPITHTVKAGRTVVLDRGVEKETGIAKVMEVTLDADSSKVTIVHRLTNHRDQQVDVAPWGLTIVRGGGTTILPNEPYVAHEARLQPVRPVALWAYTDLSDPRWALGPKFIRLSTDRARSNPQKIGVGNRQGWAAYVEGGDLFIKRTAPFDDAKRYPDYGTTYQTYTAGNFMEVESLGPLVTLTPKASTEHVETWWLFGEAAVAGDDEAVEKALAPYLQRAQ
jgi:hypothetical protein